MTVRDAGDDAAMRAVALVASGNRLPALRLMNHED